jgi:arylsulfatase A-like enzyme
VGSRPNLVILMADQLRADALSAFAPADRRTAHAPVLEDLGRRATVFTDAHVQHPVCGPSRVSLMTGWYPHVHGHRTLTNLLKPWHPNLLRLARDGGSTVCFAGRRGDVFAPGVTEASTDVCGWLVRPKHGFSPSPYEEHSPAWNAMLVGRRRHDPADGPVLDFDEACVQTAEQWLEDAPPEPWVLFVPLLFPHPPFEVEDPWYSLHTYGDLPPRVPPMSGKPAFQAALREIKDFDRMEDDHWAEVQRTYFGMVSRVDHHLGRVLRAVDRAGAAERTVTVFCSDHGEYAGDFGLVEKWPSGLDGCLTRTPLLIHDPRRSGGVVRAPVELVDLLPTLAELGDFPVQHTHFGRSLVPVMDDPTLSHRPFAATEGGFRVTDAELLEEPIPGPYEAKARLQRERPHLVGLAVSLRTPEHTYVHRHEEGEELYDRASDPDETTNVAGDDGSATVLAGFRSRLTRWLVETSDVIPWERDPRFPSVPDGYRS